MLAEPIEGKRRAISERRPICGKRDLCHRGRRFPPRRRIAQRVRVRGRVAPECHDDPLVKRRGRIAANRQFRLRHGPGRACLRMLIHIDTTRRGGDVGRQHRSVIREITTGTAIVRRRRIIIEQDPNGLDARARLGIL